MSDIVISKFPGIAPRYRSAEAGAITHATEAEYADLYGETLRPFKGNTFVEAGHSGPEIFFSGPEATGVWESGQSNYVEVTQDGSEILIYKDSFDGKFKRKVDGVTSLLGIARPATPSIVEITVSEPTPVIPIQEVELAPFLAKAVYVYYITFSTFRNGSEIEGPKSVAIPVSVYGGPEPDRHHVIERPTVIPPEAQTWNVYRSDDGDTAQLIKTGIVSGIGEGFDLITDQKASLDRGREIEFIRRADDEEDYRFSYVMTWVRETGDFIDESGPSDPTALRVQTPGIKVTRPLSVPSFVTKWRLYRISTDFDPTTDFQLVSEIDIVETFFEDAFVNADLGALITTSFENEDGDTITYDKPEVDFVGISLRPHYGMLFGWKDDRLYYSEPGKIDAWPHLNKLTTLGDIVGVEANGGELLVMTKSGVQRLVGTDPEKIFLATAITDDGATSRRGMVSYKGGTVYLSEGGINLISGANAESLSDSKLGEEFFRNINKETAFMAFNDGLLYLFHDAGMLIFDTRIGEFTVMPDIFLDPHRINRNGLLYVLDSIGNIKSLHDSGDNQTLRYTTGDIVLSSPEHKMFRKAEFTGSGVADIEIFIDGTLMVSQDIDMDAGLLDRQVNIPHGERGRAARVRIETEGEIKEIRMEVFDTI